MIELTDKPIDVWPVLQSVATERAGGLAHFIGTVRREGDLKGLQYECYPEMAQRQMEAIVAETKERWPIEKVSVAHRHGWVPLGEAAVVIAVSSAHRREAFAACQFLIDRIKQVVPIWKGVNSERVLARSDLLRLAKRSER